MQRFVAVIAKENGKAENIVIFVSFSFLVNTGNT
jgi:hypothetical protein